MPDVALSASPSPLAALLSGGGADSTATTAAASQGSDPFAALLASAVSIKTADASAGTKTTDPLTALLASAAPAAIAPIAATPITVAMTAAASPVLPVAAEALPAESDAVHSTSKAKTAAKDEDDNADPDSKGDDGDPLADAIASGATAVLALAPAIVTPVQPQTPLPPLAQTQIAIDAPNASKLPKLRPTADLTPARDATADTQVPAQTDRTGGPQNQVDADAAQGEAQAPQQKPQQQAAETAPTTVALSPDAAKAVVAALKQGGANPATVAEADTTSAPIAAEAAKNQLQQQVQQPQPAALQHAPRQAEPVQPAPARRRSDEVAAPRRTGDTRKRVDAAPTDAASAGLGQRGSEGLQPAISRPVTDVHAKGDTIVEQTLTIARDGAWLDKLAHDIAGAGSGNELHFQLAPQNLGALSVAIRQSDDGASIRLTADNQTTRDILVDAQPKLIAEARAQGLKVSDTQVDVRQDQNHSQNQSPSQDMHRWPQNQSGHNGGSQNGQNRQSSPGHQPFVSNLGRKAESDSESPDRDSDARYA